MGVTDDSKDNSSKNPVPLWGTVMIGIAGGIFLLCCIVLACRNCCCRRKDKHSSSRNIGYKDINSQETNDSKIQPELEDLGPLFRKENFGKLQFALEYDKHVEELEVTVIQAMDLRGATAISILNVFVRVYVSPHFKPIYETEIERMTSNPVYNQKYVFKLPYQSRHSKKLVFGFYDVPMILSEPDKIGQLRIDLGAYDLAKRVEEWHDIEKPEPEEQDTNLGDICVSLRFVPTPGRLTVVVLEAKGLKELHRQPKDYYVKLALVLKKKTLRKRKTTTKQQTTNPYYNEAFIFDATYETMQAAYLKVTVTVPRQLGLPGRSKCVGGLSLGLGSQASDSSLKHWQEVLTNVGRPIVHWHPLVPVSDR